MAHEYELIEHNEIGGFKLFLVNMLYRTPHNHKDLELCLILRGSIDIRHIEGSFTAREGSFFLMNSFQPHELQAKEPALILALQVSPDFFAPYFPQIETIHFEVGPVSGEHSPLAKDLITKILSLAHTYLLAQPMYELKCAAGVNDVFLDLLRVLHWKNISSHERELFTERQMKFRYLTNAIDSRYSGKLLLGDLAEEMHVSIYYLSHFFRDCFGMPFQEYLSRVRCENARRLLLLTDRSLLEVSIACGFSDPKYFNSGFRSLYGITPKEYRKKFKEAPLPSQQSSMLTTQKFLSSEASLVLLDQSLT